jgi:hypothetical protein
MLDIVPDGKNHSSQLRMCLETLVVGPLHQEIFQSTKGSTIQMKKRAHNSQTKTSPWRVDSLEHTPFLGFVVVDGDCNETDADFVM